MVSFPSHSMLHDMHLQHSSRPIISPVSSVMEHSSTRKLHLLNDSSRRNLTGFPFFSAGGDSVKAARTLGDSVHVGIRAPLEIVRPFRPPYEPLKHGDAVLNTIFPKSVIDLKSMKYLPVVRLAASHTPSHLVHQKTKKFKRDVADNFTVNDEWNTDSGSYIKIESPLGEPRQKPLVPSWSTVQYNRRPVINTPWMKDTQGIAMTTVNNINAAMLELSDTDIQRETAKANLVLVQRMGELVHAEKDKVKAEMTRVQSDIERIVSEKERNLMEMQKLEMEKELYETRLLSGSARVDVS